jgi:DNA-binding transcriptional LysR family regulator
MAPVDGVHRLEVRHVAEVHADPHDIVESPARRLEDRGDVAKDLRRLRVDPALDELASGRILRHLAAQIEQLPRANSRRERANGRRDAIAGVHVTGHEGLRIEEGEWGTSSALTMTGATLPRQGALACLPCVRAALGGTLGLVLEWSDLRVFLAVSTSSSFTAAAKAVHLDQTTVGRRIASLEATLGTKLFRRGRDGLALTAEGHEVLRLAREMEVAALALERRVAGRDRAAQGPVRMATIETFGSRFLAPRAPEFCQEHPEIEWTLVTSSRTVSLTRREADVAVRLERPPQADLVVRKLGTYAYALYASPSYLAKRAAARTDLAAHDVLGFDEELSSIPESIWLSERTHRYALRSNSFSVLERAAMAGAGVAVLPCFLADAREDLVRVDPSEDVSARSLWIVVHAELATQTRVRAVVDFVTRQFVASRDSFAGRVRRTR